MRQILYQNNANNDFKIITGILYAIYNMYCDIISFKNRTEHIKEIDEEGVNIK